MAADGLLGVIVGGVIGIAGAIASGLIPQLLAQRRAKASARAITRAYVSGILKMEEVRQHGKLYRDNLAALREEATSGLLRIFGVEDTSDELQRSLIDHLGLLAPDIAGDLVRFCNQLAGLKG